MASYSTNQFKRGLKILIDNDPCSIIENEIVKPGKGQAFNRVKIRNLISGRVVERTYKSGESVESADVMDVDMQYLYNDGEEWHFMDPDTFEQISASVSVVGDEKKWLKEQDISSVTLWNGSPISVLPPNHVVLKVVECEPAVKGDTAQGATKPVTLETGATVSVPLFIDMDDLLKIDTRTGEYLSRAKE